ATVQISDLTDQQVLDARQQHNCGADWPAIAATFNVDAKALETEVLEYTEPMEDHEWAAATSRLSAGETVEQIAADFDITPQRLKEAFAAHNAKAAKAAAKAGKQPKLAKPAPAAAPAAAESPKEKPSKKAKAVAAAAAAATPAPGGF